MTNKYFGFTQEQHEWAEREISHLVCASHLVESVMRANAEYPHSEISDFSFYDISNNTTNHCESCGEEIDSEDIETCPGCGESVEDTEVRYSEIFEWWIIPSNWMTNRLEQSGQPILRARGLNFWGRMTTGQAIILDGVFQRIKIDLEKELSCEK